MPTRDLTEVETGYEGLNFGSMLREYLASGMISVDDAEKLIALSPEAERTLGLSAGHVRSFDALPEAVQSVIREARLTGHAIVERRIVLHSNGSSATPLSITALPVAAETGVNVFALL